MYTFGILEYTLNLSMRKVNTVVKDTTKALPRKPYPPTRISSYLLKHRNSLCASLPAHQVSVSPSCIPYSYLGLRKGNTNPYMCLAMGEDLLLTELFCSWETRPGTENK